MAFRAADYASVSAHLRPPPATGSGFTARLTGARRRRGWPPAATSTTVGQLRSADVARARRRRGPRARGRPGAGRVPVTRVEEKPYTRRPAAPFTTSTLQQEAVAQAAPEQQAGHAGRAVAVRGRLHHLHADRLHRAVGAGRGRRPRARPATCTARSPCRQPPRVYTGKAKNAQEAHEAIRPAGDSFRTPAQVAGALRGEEFRLYELIWQRTVASQMADARGTTASRPHRGHRRRRPRRRAVRLRHGHHLPRVPRRLRGGPRRRPRRRGGRRRRRREPPAEARAGRPRGRRGPRHRPSTGPARPPATPRPAWSRRWRSAASAARPPTPRRSARSSTGATCATRATPWCRSGWPSR